MGSLVLILVFGAVLGKLIEESGAAHTISYALTNMLGQRRIQISVLLTGFIVGLPMIYNASFLVLIPLIYTLAETTGLPLMYLGIPLSSALSVTHGYLPPHPAPTSIAVMYHADINRTLLYGLVLADPRYDAGRPRAGKVLPQSAQHAAAGVLQAAGVLAGSSLPGLGVSLFTTLIPVLLMLAGAVVEMTAPPRRRSFAAAAKFLSDPNVALLAAVHGGALHARAAARPPHGRPDEERGRGGRQRLDGHPDHRLGRRLQAGVAGLRDGRSHQDAGHPIAPVAVVAGLVDGGADAPGAGLGHRGGHHRRRNRAARWCPEPASLRSCW